MARIDLHRGIVDVLLAEYDRTQPPDRNSGYPTKQLACAWGLYCEIHRLARAATMLIDNNMSHESGIMARVMLEHTVVLHWIIERGDDGVDALLANQAKRMKTWVDRTTKESTLELPAELATELASGFPDIDEKKALGQFERICRELDVVDLYVAYGFLSNFVHPTTTTSNIYCDPSGRLKLEPTTGLGNRNISLIAYCLIWAERDFDRLTPGQPRADELERLAKSVDAKPILPPYKQLPPAAPKKRARGRRSGK
jgi:hypothetical protein